MLIFRKTKFLYRYNPMNLLKLCRMMSDYKKGELYYVEENYSYCCRFKYHYFFKRICRSPSQTPAEQNRYIDVQMLGINDFHGQLDTIKKLITKKLVVLIT